MLNSAASTCKHPPKDTFFMSLGFPFPLPQYQKLLGVVYSLTQILTEEIISISFFIDTNNCKIDNMICGLNDFVYWNSLFESSVTSLFLEQTLSIQIVPPSHTYTKACTVQYALRYSLFSNMQTFNSRTST